MSDTDEIKKVNWDDELQKKFLCGLRHNPSKTELAVAERLFNFLAAQPTPVSETAIMSSVTGKKTTKVSILRSLVEFRLVFRSVSGGKSKPFQYHADKSFIDGIEAVTGSSLSKYETVRYCLAENIVRTQSILPTITPPQIKPDGCTPYYKRLKLPDGDIIEVTKEEFNRIVEFYRNLHAQAVAHPNLLNKK